MSRTVSLPLSLVSDPFAARLAVDRQDLRRAAVSALQLNLGKMCNLACHHCHVEAGPGRTEVMGWDVAERILAWVDRHRAQLDLKVVDLTGGAPEMNPHFRRIVAETRRRGIHVLDRCNLTILLEADHEGLVSFLADHRVEVVASLPCYLEDNVEAQRGRGVFAESIQALRLLNAVGYGRAGSDLRLDLVYNPVGYGLPPGQEALERDYKRELGQRFGIVFNRLWTITNMPIRRFAHALQRDGMFETYTDRLKDAHQGANVAAVMCRSLVSVGWEGAVYDCDFNQMLQMPIEPDGLGDGADEHVVERSARKLWEFDPQALIGRAIRTGSHCFGCTAGAGSSCTGSLNLHQSTGSAGVDR